MTDVTIPDAAVEAVARELALLDEGDPWPSNVQLGGHPLLGTRDDEYRHSMREHATELLTVAAPYIAAQALRDAAEAFYGPDGPRGEVGPAVWLKRQADQIEADHG